MRIRPCRKRHHRAADAPGNVPVTIEQILDPELVGSGTGQKSK